MIQIRPEIVSCFPGFKRPASSLQTFPVAVSPSFSGCLLLLNFREGVSALCNCQQVLLAPHCASSAQAGKFQEPSIRPSRSQSPTGTTPCKPGITINAVGGMRSPSDYLQTVVYILPPSFSQGLSGAAPTVGLQRSVFLGSAAPSTWNSSKPLL